MLGLSKIFFKGAILRAITEYNKYRSPEAKAKLIALKENELILDVEGTFCRACGVWNYLDDFVYELRKNTGLEAEIVNFNEYAPEKIRVTYTLKRTKRSPAP